MNHYAKFLSTNGRLYTSGFISTDKDILVGSAQKHGFKHLSSKEDGEWSALAFR